MHSARPSTGHKAICKPDLPDRIIPLVGVAVTTEHARKRRRGVNGTHFCGARDPLSAIFSPRCRASFTRAIYARSYTSRLRVNHVFRCSRCRATTGDRSADFDPLLSYLGAILSRALQRAYFPSGILSPAYQAHLVCIHRRPHGVIRAGRGDLADPKPSTSPRPGCAPARVRTGMRHDPERINNVEIIWD